MKFIFDFDDVLFNNTRQFKPHMYSCLEKYGISRDIAELYYKQVRDNEFWLKEMISHFNLPDNFYYELIDTNILQNFLNHELIDLVKNIGKEKCMILTHGSTEWQLDKIKNSGIEDLFLKVIVVFKNKKEVLEKIHSTYANEKIIFIDDKDKYIQELNNLAYPNLKTILFDNNGMKKLKAEIYQ